MDATITLSLTAAVLMMCLLQRLNAQTMPIGTYTNYLLYQERDKMSSSDYLFYLFKHLLYTHNEKIKYNSQNIMQTSAFNREIFVNRLIEQNVD